MFSMFSLAIVGGISVSFVVIDSLWSFLELLSSYLMPYFLPSEVQPLTKRFGPWAGELSPIINLPALAMF